MIDISSYQENIIDYALKNPCLQALQALAILALANIASGSPRIWGIMALLNRLSLALSLHTTDAPTKNERTSMTSVYLISSTTIPSELEERRRCFWAVFTLDRFFSASTGWPTCLPEKEIQVHLPSDKQWAVCIESAGILGKVTEWLRTKYPHTNSTPEEDGDELLRKIEAWWDATVKSQDNVLLHCTFDTYSPSPGRG